MLQVIKAECSRWHCKFCEMLQVKLHLLRLLQNFMTALLMVPGAKPLVTALCARVACIVAEYCE